MPIVPHRLSGQRGPEKKTCVDCIHALDCGDVKDKTKRGRGAEPAVGREYRCLHPDELFADDQNRKLGNWFPCEKWEQKLG